MRRTAILASALLAVVATVGVVGMLSLDRGSGRAELPVAAGGQTSSDATGAGSGSGVAGAGGAVPATLSAPKVVKTATLRVEVDNGSFATAFSRVATIASGAGGFVSSSTSAAAGDGGRAAGSLVLRVPSAAFDDVRTRLARLGTVRSEELNGTDVGAQVADIEARLRNLRAQEEAIRVLMGRSGTVGETLQVQNQLGEVRGQIEQLDAQRARLDDSVAYATLTVELAEPAAAAAGEQTPLARAFGRAVEGAGDVTAAAIVAVGYLTPLGLALLLGLAGLRMLRRGRPAPVVAEHGA